MSSDDDDDDVFSTTDRVEEPRYWLRLAACFGLLYLLLYGLPFPLGSLPSQGGQWPLAAAATWATETVTGEELEEAPKWSRYPGKWLGEVEEEIDWSVVQFGVHVLRQEQDEVEPKVTGSGDTLHDWVRTALALVLALLAAPLLAWPIGRRGLRWWYRSTRVLVRYGLAATMTTYGFVKAYPLQFSAPTGDRLYGTFGDASPMNMLWTFMGSSPAYTSLSGIAEVVGGLLLLFRRTTTAGALLSGAVMSNVLALNLCYDVPVKLFSAHMVLFAAFLLIAPAPRLWRALFSQQAIPAAPEPRAPAWLRWPGYGLKVIAFLAIFVAPWVFMDQYWAQRSARPTGPLAGIWEVREFESDLAAPDQWHRLVISYAGSAEAPTAYSAIVENDRDTHRGQAVIDEDARTITVTQQNEPEESAPTFTLGYEPQPTEPGAERANERLVITGTVDGHDVRAVVERRDEASFRLNSTGFRWVQEVPFNRNQK